MKKRARVGDCHGLQAPIVKAVGAFLLVEF